MEFKAQGLPTLIGSLPHKDHYEATRLVFKHTPQIPLWVQLPCYPQERLLSQFAENLPGLKGWPESPYFDVSQPDFDQQLHHFFEEYLECTEGGKPLGESIFAFSNSTGKGLEALIKVTRQASEQPYALKGQITGPFTMLTGLKDEQDRMAFFNPILKEAVVKGLGLKARYQIERLQSAGQKVLLFLDEPALAGFGSSQMVTVQKKDVVQDLSEVIHEIHGAGALAGIHVCANTDWSLILDTPVDILSFDAYGFFDRILLFKDALTSFVKKGGIIAWGLVPTLNDADLEREDTQSLYARWFECVRSMELDEDFLIQHSLITPSCGTGLLSVNLAEKALRLTRELSDSIRG